MEKCSERSNHKPPHYDLGCPGGPRPNHHHGGHGIHHTNLIQTWIFMDFSMRRCQNRPLFVEPQVQVTDVTRNSVKQPRSL